MRMLPPQVELDPLLLMLTIWLLAIAFAICSLREHGIPRYSGNKHGTRKGETNKNGR